MTEGADGAPLAARVIENATMAVAENTTTPPLEGLQSLIRIPPLVRKSGPTPRTATLRFEVLVFPTFVSPTDSSSQRLEGAEQASWRDLDSL